MLWYIDWDNQVWRTLVYIHAPASGPVCDPSLPIHHMHCTQQMKRTVPDSSLASDSKVVLS